MTKWKSGQFFSLNKEKVAEQRKAGEGEARRRKKKKVYVRHPALGANVREGKRVGHIMGKGRREVCTTEHVRFHLYPTGDVLLHLPTKIRLQKLLEYNIRHRYLV